MRKEIRSKSKRKWVVGGALFFGGIALLTTGFASWVVGLTITEQQGNVGVTVDTAENQSQIFSAVMSDTGIKLSEQHTKVDGEIIGNENGAEDFTISFSSLTITQGSTVSKPKVINVSLHDEPEIPEGANDVTDALTVAGDKNLIGKTNLDPEVSEEEKFKKVRAEGPGISYTYIDLNIKRIWLVSDDLQKAKDETRNDKIENWIADNGEEYEIETVDAFIASTNNVVIAAKESINKEVQAAYADSVSAGGQWNTVNGTSTYTAANASVPNLFKWGSYFDGVTPCTYYNKLYKEDKIGSTYGDIDKVYQELNAMYAALNKTNAIIPLKLAI